MNVSIHNCSSAIEPRLANQYFMNLSIRHVSLYAWGTFEALVEYILIVFKHTQGVTFFFSDSSYPMDSVRNYRCAFRVLECILKVFCEYFCIFSSKFVSFLD